MKEANERQLVRLGKGRQGKCGRGRDQGGARKKSTRSKLSKDSEKRHQKLQLFQLRTMWGNN